VDVQPPRGNLTNRVPRLSADHIGELVRELAGAFEGTTIKDVDALPPADLVLVADAPRDDGTPGIRRLLVSASPDAPRLHALHGRVRRARGPRGPFFERVQRELTGARLREIRQVRGDRIVRLTWDRDGERHGLLCELVGRHANLVLVDRTDRVLAMLVEPPAKKGADARLVVGEPWQPPPGTSGGGPALPPLNAHLPEPTDAPPERSHAPLPLSWRVEWNLGGSADALAAAKERKRLVERLTRRKKRTRSRLDGLARRAAAAAGAQRVQQDGELLKAHLGSFRRGDAFVLLDDWYGDGSARRIELDPKLTPQANVERLFARYRKLLRDAAGLDDERARLEERARELDAWLERARAPELDRDALLALGREAEEAGVLEPAQVADPRKRKEPPPRKPYRTFQAQSGAEIRVGRNATDNDALTFRHARGNDLWLHTADAPGSHVIVPLARGAEPDPEDVLDAGHLAVWFSPLKEAAKADVHVARRKEVKKPKGAPAGLVHVAGGRTLAVRMQPERLRRLLGP